jgi:hypothetical protein
MGTFYTTIELRNTSSQSCTLRGFPELSFVGCRHDHWQPCSSTYPLRLRIDHWDEFWGGSSPHVVPLAPDARAEFRLGAGVGGYMRHDEITALRMHVLAGDAGLVLRVDSPVSGPPGKRDVIGVTPYHPAERSHS